MADNVLVNGVNVATKEVAGAHIQKQTPVDQTGAAIAPATSAQMIAQAALLGAVDESDGASDDAATGIRGALRRIAKRITSLIALFPSSLGQKPKATSLAVTLASDDDALAKLDLLATEETLGNMATDIGLLRVAAQDGSPAAVFGPIQYVDVTLTLDTSAYTAGDVLADTQAIAAAVRADDAKGVLHSVSIIDQDDQKAEFFVFLQSSNVAMGTENSAPSISDANAIEVLGPPVHIPSGAFNASTNPNGWHDLGGVAISGKDAIGKVVKPAAGTDDVYFSLVLGASTPTFTSGGLKMRFGFLS